MPNRLRSTEEVYAVLDGAVPELPALLEAAAGAPLYVVGGTVRDLLLGRGRTDLDVSVEGDAAEVARRLGGEVLEHERFSTAKATLGGAEIDLASTRGEDYAHPGALPDVRPAGIDADLARRDFTVNAMALPLQGPPGLIDPHGGRADLSEGVLRILHGDSLRDDPMRAVRGARYAARFGLVPDAETGRLLAGADLATVSDDRRGAELLRLAREPAAAEGFRLLGEWGVLDVPAEAAALIDRAAELLAAPPWSGVAERGRTLLAAAGGPTERARELAGARPGRPSEGVELARGARPEELVLARALGAEWLDDYVTRWRSVMLEIDGRDLLEAGVPEGPEVGRGLHAALRAKLDGEAAGAEAELDVALRAARTS
jgi:tRNA nucleotidyltransferase (CCA-adding enzyme)